MVRKDPGEVTFEQIVEGRERSEPQMYKSEEGNQQKTQILWCSGGATHQNGKF